MFVLNDKDKSAYGTLKGLVEAIKIEIKSLERQRIQCGNSLRSHDAMKVTGEIYGHNNVLSLIWSTDIWIKGQHEEELADPQPHWHATGPGLDYRASTSSLLRNLLAERGYRFSDAYDMAAVGFSVRMCSEEICLASGTWIAKSTSTPETP